MTVFYNRIAGQSLERLKALSDGIFAFAMTLLVLDLHIPAAAAIHSERDLVRALLALGPRLLTYLMSFITLGIFWVAQQTMHDHMARSDRSYSWVNIAFLMAVTLVPFSTGLLAEFIAYRTALVVYWLNILLLGLLIGGMLYRAKTFGLLKAEVSAEDYRAVVRRTVTAQALYAMGAALCAISNWWAIGFIVAVQLIYAIAPRFKPFSWL